MSDPEENTNNGMMNNAATKETDWKSKLSPAFNDEQVFFSLLLLGVYYVGYTIAKARVNADSASLDNDERFIQSCYCSTPQRTFFRAWFLLFCAIWLIIHSYVIFAQVFVKKCAECGDIMIRLLTIGSVCLDSIFSYLYRKYICKLKAKLCLSCKNNCPISSQNHLKMPKESESKMTEIEKTMRLLWFQYCKLYVVGYTKDVVADKKQQNEDQTDTAQEKHCCSYECTYQSNQKGDCVCCKNHIACPNIEIICCKQSFPSSHILKSIIWAFLTLIKYVSQLVTVPLLLLQVFDTYSLLCFSPDLYCPRTSEYKLHLAQAAITLLFYCSLALSQLASTMLAWNPWPQKNIRNKQPKKKI